MQTHMKTFAIHRKKQSLVLSRNALNYKEQHSVLEILREVIHAIKQTKQYTAVGLTRERASVAPNLC